MRQPLSENAIGHLYNRERWKGLHVPHGRRSSFSTVMNALAERQHPGTDGLEMDRLIIDMMLPHLPVETSAAEFRYSWQATWSAAARSRVSEPSSS